MYVWVAKPENKAEGHEVLEVSLPEHRRHRLKVTILVMVNGMEEGEKALKVS